MQNKLIDLNNHLFAEIERLSDEETTGDKLREEIGRAKAITDVATQIINNGTLVVNATNAARKFVNGNSKINLLLGE